MISIELHLPTISLIAFICLLLPLVPTVISLILTISHYTGGLRIVSGLLASFLTLHVLSLFFCGLFPKRPIVLIFDIFTLVGVLSTGCVWGSKRLYLINEAANSPVLEVALFILWAITLVVSTCYLAIAITETMISINHLSINEPATMAPKQLNEKPSQDTVITASTLFSTPTTDYAMSIPNEIPSNEEEYRDMHDIDQLTAENHGLTISNTGNFNYIPAQYIQYQPNQVDSSTLGSTINSENNSQKTIRKHKSSNSFLSFFGSPETANSPKPTLKAHHKSESLLGKLSHQMKSSVTTFRSSNSQSTLSTKNNSANNNNTSNSNPPVSTTNPNYQYEVGEYQHSTAFDGWEINSLGIKDRLEWSLNQLDNTSSIIQQSRNVSGMSKLTTSTYATNFNHKINSAGFTRDARSLIAYRGLQSGSRRIPSDPGSWRLRADDSLTDDSGGPATGGEEPLAQYDRERLSNSSC